MFTGIVDHVGRIQSIERARDLLRLKMNSRFMGLMLGESISLDGACLSVVSVNAGSFSVDVSPETTSRTIANLYQVGTEVNLERALRLGDSLGGHWVIGHIDTQAKVVTKRNLGEFVKLDFMIDRSSKDSGYSHGLMVEKGSVSINGVSLTINGIWRNGFSVMLIPITLERTNLKSLIVEDRVNIEFDHLAKLVHAQLMPLKERDQ